MKGIELKTLKGHVGEVYSLVVLPDGSLASGSFDNTIRVWDYAKKIALRHLQDILVVSLH